MTRADEPRPDDETAADRDDATAPLPEVTIRLSVPAFNELVRALQAPDPPGRRPASSDEVDNPESCDHFNRWY
jgi:hypothetical protein